MSYELYNCGKVPEAMTRIEKCVETLDELSQCTEHLYLNMRRPLGHITLATRALLLASLTHLPITPNVSKTQFVTFLL